MVTKRHNTRLVSRERRFQVGKSQNLPAGTIVDQAITSSDIFDFYLIGSQDRVRNWKAQPTNKVSLFSTYAFPFRTLVQGIQGTSIPTHYRVCHDDNNLHVDSAQV